MTHERAVTGYIGPQLSILIPIVPTIEFQWRQIVEVLDVVSKAGLVVLKSASARRYARIPDSGCNTEGRKWR